MAIDGKQARQHHHVAFAISYFRGAFRTFNAASALSRMGQLVEEAERMATLLQEHPSDLYPATLPHFPGYYLVGYVTCLEWHARSRLADLLTHFPDQTTADDLKAVTESGKLREMVALRLTVPELVGASASVSNLRDYAAIFDRVLEAITPPGSRVRTSDAIKAGDVPEETSAWVELERMYKGRHRLVHEISNEQIGHYALRDTVSIEDAQRTGRLVENCMRRIETIITENAPRAFPNILDVQGYPVSEPDRLRRDIEAVEERLQARAVVELNGGYQAGLDIGGVTPAIAAGRQYIEAELGWLRDFRPAGWRYHSPANDLEVILLRNRLDYLRDVEEIIKTA